MEEGAQLPEKARPLKRAATGYGSGISAREGSTVRLRWLERRKHITRLDETERFLTSFGMTGGGFGAFENGERRRQRVLTGPSGCLRHW